MTEDEMVGWHHQLNGHGFQWTLGVGDGQEGLACCGSWGHKESHQITNATELTKCGWSPYNGVTVQTKVTHTFVNGNLVYENGLFHEEDRGERLIFN